MPEATKPAQKGRIRHLLRRIHDTILGPEPIPLPGQYAVEEGYHIRGHSYYGRVWYTFGDNLPKIGTGSAILDLGCSNGNTTIELANIHKGCMVIGVDLNPNQVSERLRVIEMAKRGFVYRGKEWTEIVTKERSGRKGELSLPSAFVVADGYSKAFRENSANAVPGAGILENYFDAVYCMNNLYYALDLGREIMARRRLEEVGMLIRSGGYLMISGKTNLGWHKDFVILRKDGERLVPECLSFSANQESRLKLGILFDSIGYSPERADSQPYRDLSET